MKFLVILGGAFFLSACSASSNDPVEDALKLLSLSVKCPIPIQKLSMDIFGRTDSVFFLENKFSADKDELTLQSSTDAVSTEISGDGSPRAKPRRSQFVTQFRVPYKLLQIKPLTEELDQNGPLYPVRLTCDSCAAVTTSEITDGLVTVLPTNKEQQKEFQIFLCDAATARNAFAALEILIRNSE